MVVQAERMLVCIQSGGLQEAAVQGPVLAVLLRGMLLDDHHAVEGRLSGLRQLERWRRRVLCRPEARLCFIRTTGCGAAGGRLGLCSRLGCRLGCRLCGAEEI